ncbi:MAG TPA: porin family protein [Parafilimonas sp.]|nr:porin family protein [Parafilimonas sp.]
MKKTIYLFISLILLMNYSKAQNAFGISAGATFSGIKAKADGITLTSDTHVGFTVGVTESMSMGKDFSFRPELNFTQKGGDLSVPDEDFKYKTTINYLELPLNFVYNTHSAKGKFFIGAGPSLNIALSGRYKMTGMGEHESGKLKFGGDETVDDYKGFDAGINAIAGYQFSGGFYLAANYNFGITNISPGSDEKDHIHYFGIRLGIMLKAKSKS